MFAELSAVTLSAMSPATSCSVMEFKALNNSPVHVRDFNHSAKPKTAMVVIPKCLLPDLDNDDSLASALAKGVAITNNNNTETSTFSCTEDSSVSSISTEEPCSPSGRRRAIFSPYWEKSGEQPVELVPTGDVEEEVVAIRSSAASVQSWRGYEYEIEKLQGPIQKPRLVKSDPVLTHPAPPSILRKPKYSGKPRRNTVPITKSEMNATSLAIAGALATIQADSIMMPPLSPKSRVKFSAKVDVRLFSKVRPMQEEAQPGWSKAFAY